MIIENNETISTLEWNLKYGKEMMDDGWENLDHKQPQDNQRVLVVGDLKSDRFISLKTARRISLCKYNSNSKTFDIADADYYIPTSENVKWWKPVTF